MSSLPRALRACLLLAVCAAAVAAETPTQTPASTPTSTAAPVPPAEPEHPPLHAAVAQAVAELSKDPKLGHPTTTRHLQWDFKNHEQPATRSDTGLGWLLDGFKFLNGAVKLLVWIGGALLAGCAAIWMWRLLKTRQASRKLRLQRHVTHVQDLDIRPTALPADIGAAALALFEAGDTRAALSLLYRGALSRAVHRFAVGIGAAFTESEVLRAVDARLDSARASYFAALVRVWQRKVYGALEPAAGEVARLCTAFAATFDVG